MSQPSEMSPPLANSCEGCPVRQLIDVDKAQCIGASSIGTQVGVWERYTDGEKPPIRLVLAEGDIDDSDTTYAVREAAARGRATKKNCPKPGEQASPNNCAGSDAKIYTEMGGPWWSAVGIMRAPEATPENIAGVISQHWAEKLEHSTWYVRSESSGWARSYDYPFAGGDNFTVKRSLSGKLAFLKKDTKCFFGTDVEDDGTRLAKVRIDDYASVCFAYETAVDPDMPSEERQEALTAEREQLQVKGLDMLLNGWDIQESTAAEARIDGKYAERRKQSSDAVDWLMSEEGQEAFSAVFEPRGEDA